MNSLGFALRKIVSRFAKRADKPSLGNSFNLLVGSGSSTLRLNGQYKRRRGQRSAGGFSRKRIGNQRDRARHIIMPT